MQNIHQPNTPSQANQYKIKKKVLNKYLDSKGKILSSTQALKFEAS